MNERDLEPALLYYLYRYYFTDKNLRVGFSKGDSTNWSYKLYPITEIIHDTTPSYRINNLPKRYNENLLLPTNLTLEQNNQVMKELNLIQKYNKKWNYARMKLLKNMVNIVDIVIEILFYHTNMNGLEYHVDIM